MGATARCLLIALLWCVSASASATVAFREWSVDGTTLSVWYPSNEAVTPRRIGPFELNYAFDGAPRPGSWPILVFSHGNGGQAHSHYLTLQALAEAGFIVVAPQHGRETVVKTRHLRNSLRQRVRDLQRGVDAVHADAQLGPVVDRRWVHGLGFGLGATTVLLAAGAEWAPELVAAHCQAHASEDLDLCSSDPMSELKQKFSGWFSAVSRGDSISAAQSFTPVHGRVALVAPMGQGLRVAPGGLSISRLLNIAIDGDAIRPPRFHAQAIDDLLPQLSTRETLSGHHYAFLAPLPSWMLGKQERFTANDPPGFERLDFLRRINAQLLRFFSSP